MRIVRLANFVAPRSGGLRTALTELGAGYLAEGHDTVLIVPGEVDSDEVTRQGRVITLRGPRVPFTGGYRVLLRRRRIAALLARLRPDSLEVSDRSTLRWTGRWARRHGVRAVMVSHESLAALLRMALPVPALARALADALNRRTARGYDQVVCTTAWAAAEFERIAAPNLHRAPLGVDLQTFAPRFSPVPFPQTGTNTDSYPPVLVESRLAAGRDAKEGAVLGSGADGAVGLDAKEGVLGQNGADGVVGRGSKDGTVGWDGADGAVGRGGADGTLLVHCGRLSVEKRPERSLATLATLLADGVEARLIVAGDGPLRERLERRAASEGLPVTFTGFINDRTELAKLLASADVVLAPGPAETFGLAALEALACGTPVVVSAESALPEVIGDAGVSVAGEDLAAGVRTVLARPEPERRAAARARAEQFGWPAAVRAFLQVHGAVKAVTARGSGGGIPQ
jgi:alpha-1,6-mannosyltransferase